MHSVLAARNLVILAAFGAIACGGPVVPADGGGADGGDDTAAVTAFLADVAARRCEGALACMADEIERSQSLGTEAHCRDAVLGELRNRPITIEQAVERGTVVFDASGAEACLAAIERDACEERVSIPVTRFMWPPECATVFAGTRAPEAECQLHEECEGGGCDCGRCVAHAAQGESCAAVACRPGLRCEEDVCVPALHAGDACTQRFPEEVAGDCPANLRCVEGTCRTSTEFRTAAEGEECYSPRDNEAPLVFCGAGLECHFTGPDVGTCVAAHAAGEACDAGGAHGLCPAGTLCHGPSTDLRCLPYLAEGDECFPSGWGDPCGPGLTCALGESRCARLAENGATCASDYDCVSGYCGEDGACAASAVRYCP